MNSINFKDIPLELFMIDSLKIENLSGETDCTRIWVTGFPIETTHDELIGAFRPYGETIEISIVHKFPKQPMAFIDMNTRCADQVIKNLDKS